MLAGIPILLSALLKGLVTTSSWASIGAVDSSVNSERRGSERFELLLPSFYAVQGGDVGSGLDLSVAEVEHP